MYSPGIGKGWFGKNPAKKENPLWKYFMRGTEKGKRQCVGCKRSLKFVPGLSNPSNLVRHLKNSHKMLFDAYCKDKLQVESNFYQYPKQSQKHGYDIAGGVDYQMIQTKRGRDMLLFAGYTFTQNRMCKDGMRWQCSYPKCKAFCRMSSAGWLTPYKTHHDHPKPSEKEIKKRILRMELKARAQSSGATPGEILRNALPAEEFHSTDRACFTRCIQRFRKSLQRKNSKAQEEVWQTPGDAIQSEKDSLKVKSPDGEPSWIAQPRSFLPEEDPTKTSNWQEPDKQLVDEKIEPYGI